MNERDIEEKLTNLDFYKNYRGKEDMLKNLLAIKHDKDSEAERCLKPRRMIRPAVVAAAAAICILAVATSVFAKGFINHFSFGKSDISQLESIDGVVISPDDVGDLRSVSVTRFDDGMEESSTSEKQVYQLKPIEYKSIEEANQYLNFKIKVPTYLPEGYELNNVQLMMAPGEYMQIANLRFTTKDFSETNPTGLFVIHETYMGENGHSSTETTESIEKIDIKGKEVILMGGGELKWEADGISYDFFTSSKEESIKIAESLID